MYHILETNNKNKLILKIERKGMPNIQREYRNFPRHFSYTPGPKHSCGSNRIPQEPKLRGEPFSTINEAMVSRGW